MTESRVNKGGRPIARPANWVSGILDCPGCGGKLFLHSGLTPATDARTGKPRVRKQRRLRLRCGGHTKRRLACGEFKATYAEPIIDVITGMFASDTTDILAFQRVSGNAHELDELNAGLRKIQGRLSATEDDDELDKLVAERKAIKARIEGFVIVADRYDYAPTGQTVAQMWDAGDDAVKRGMALAVKASLGMALTEHDGQRVIAVGTAGHDGPAGEMRIVDLGNGLCFRR